jgi:signal transduction histidine kinase/ligand-binding sensor domain-containing protein/DNA-binding response OmpR family regulator
MKHFIKLLSIVFFFFIVNQTFSQSEQLEFDCLDISFGLENNDVEAIYQDSYGFLWFGFNELYRYDSHNIRIYKKTPLQPDSYPAKLTFCLFEDSKKNLWAGTNIGLLRYDREHDLFVNMNFNNIGEVRAIVEQNNGILWIGSSKGLFRLNIDKLEISEVNYLITNKTERVYKYVTNLYLNNDNELYIGSFSNRLLVKFDIKKKSFEYFNLHEINNNLSPNTVIAQITKDKHENLWLGLREDGIMSFNLQTHQWQLYPMDSLKNTPLNSQVMSLAALKNGKIYIGTNGAGLTMLEPETGKCNFFRNSIENKQSISSDVITCIYESPSGIIWIGTQFGGLNILDVYKKKFNTFQPNPFRANSLSNKYINDFIESKDGIIWIATDKGGLNRFNPVTKKFESYTNIPLNNHSIGNDNLIQLAIDNEGNIWSTNWEGGLNKLNPSTGIFTNYWNNPLNTKSLGGNNTLALLFDKTNNLWISNHYGIGPDNQVLYNGTSEFENFPNLKYTEISARFPANTFFQDANSNIWIGGLEGGIDIYNPNTETYRSYYPSDSAAGLNAISSSVNCIFQDDQQQIWIGTENAGFYLFNSDDSSFTNVNITDNLGFENVRSILQDDESNLWIGTSKGLVKYNAETKVQHTYTTDDNLPSNIFIKGAALKAKSGLFYFGTANGFITFYPKQITNNPIIPPVYLLNFWINGKKIITDSLYNNHLILDKELPFANKITLRHNENSFTFDYVAINFTSPNKINYVYMLEGFDNDWISNNHLQTVSYTNIDPGTYTFKVKASNNDGIWNEKCTAIQLEILPPFWRTYWFYLIIAFLFIAIELTIRRIIIDHLNLVNRIKIEEQRSEFVKKENELNQQRIKFFFNISHELRTPLTLILGPIENLIEKPESPDLKNKLASVKANADHLLRLVNQFLDLYKLESKRMKLELVEADIVDFTANLITSFNELANQKKINFTQTFEIKNCLAFFDSDILEKILFNLLSNAFKYTPSGGEISVNLQFKNDHRNCKMVIITITDSGIGIERAYHHSIFERFFQLENNQTQLNAGTGIGLSLAKELITLHKGSIRVESEPGEGSRFIVELPIDKNSFAGYSISKELSTTIKHFIPKTNLEPEKQEPDNFANFPYPIEENMNHLLVVEDNKEMRDFIIESLSGNYKILEAENGDEALKIALSKLPNLIISDVMIPGINGMELTHLLKTDERTSHIPIIMLTALFEIDKQIEGLKTGADDYITKPFNAKLLNARVENLLENRKNLKILFNKKNLFSIDKISPSIVDTQFLAKSVKIIEENLAEPDFTPEKFAQMMALSRVQLYRKINALTNYPVFEFIKTIRLKKAAEMLSSGKYNVTETAYLVGFKDITHFSKSFKKTFGISPSKFNK